MSRKLLLDTNVLLDVAMGERAGWAAATLLVDEFAYGQSIGYVSALSLKDVYYILCKYADEPSARAYVLAVMDLFEVIPVDMGLCRIAAQSDEPDFEDGLIRACAEHAGVDYIISRDEAAFAKSPVKRLSPRQYLDEFCEVEDISMDMSKNYRETLDECMKDPQFAAEWDALDPEFQIIKAMLDGRVAKNLTQKELSEITGINQADISKLENGNANPSLKTLERLAAGLGMRVKIEFVPV